MEKHVSSVVSCLLPLLLMVMTVPSLSSGRLVRLFDVPEGLPYRVEFRDRWLTVDGQPTLILSAGMHYTRASVSEWYRLLDYARSSGFNAVQTYVVWGEHEPEHGEYTFEGSKDLFDFIRLAAAHNLFVILNIGPGICGDFDFGGLPHWLQYVPDIIIRDPDNPPWRYWLNRWLTSITTLISPYLATNGGPVIMLATEPCGCPTNSYWYRGDIQPRRNHTFAPSSANSSHSHVGAAASFLQLEGCFLRKGRENGSDRDGRGVKEDDMLLAEKHRQWMTDRVDELVQEAKTGRRIPVVTCPGGDDRVIDALYGQGTLADASEWERGEADEPEGVLAGLTRRAKATFGLGDDGGGGSEDAGKRIKRRKKDKVVLRQGLLPACQGFDCGDWADYACHGGRLPCLWSEHWTGMASHWGEGQLDRPASHIAYAVLEWFAKGGTVMNYHLWAGGSNFHRRSAGRLVPTSYDFAFALDEYAFARTPKFQHLLHLNAVLHMYSDVLMERHPRMPTTVAMPPARTPLKDVKGRGGDHTYALDWGPVAFLINTGSPKSSRVKWRGHSLHITPRTVVVFDRHLDTMVYNSSHISFKLPSPKPAPHTHPSIFVKPWKIFRRQPTTTTHGHLTADIEPGELRLRGMDTEESAGAAGGGGTRVIQKGVFRPSEGPLVFRESMVDFSRVRDEPLSNYRYFSPELRHEAFLRERVFWADAPNTLTGDDWAAVRQCLVRGGSVLFEVPQSQMILTLGYTDAMWYVWQMNHTSGTSIASQIGKWRKKHSRLELLLPEMSEPDALQVFIDGTPLTTWTPIDHQPTPNSKGQQPQPPAVRLSIPSHFNQIAILSVCMGLSWPWVGSVFSPVGIWGGVPIISPPKGAGGREQLRMYGWIHRAGLQGERLKLSTNFSADEWTAGGNTTSGANAWRDGLPLWSQVEVSVDEPIDLVKGRYSLVLFDDANASSLSLVGGAAAAPLPSLYKGFVYINGRPLGRYWRIKNPPAPATSGRRSRRQHHEAPKCPDWEWSPVNPHCRVGAGELSQQRLHIPADWLRQGPNVLVLVDEWGRLPTSIAVVHEQADGTDIPLTVGPTDDPLPWEGGELFIRLSARWRIEQQRAMLVVCVGAVLCVLLAVWVVVGDWARKKVLHWQIAEELRQLGIITSDE